jgi:hypothetical protein
MDYAHMGGAWSMAIVKVEGLSVTADGLIGEVTVKASFDRDTAPEWLYRLAADRMKLLPEPPAV